MHSIKKYVNKGERKDSAMPTLDKAKAWAGEGHNKEREKKRALCWACRILPRPSLPIVGGSFCSRTGLNLWLSGLCFLLLHQAVFPVETGETLSADPRPLSPLLARAVPVPGGRPE